MLTAIDQFCVLYLIFFFPFNVSQLHNGLTGGFTHPWNELPLFESRELSFVHNIQVLKGQWTRWKISN